MNSFGHPPPAHEAGRPFGVEIQHLLTFLAVYEDRRVSHAARRLGRTPSALSHSLSKLRELMADDLFIVREGEMWPTAEAQRLYPRIRQAVDLIDSLQVRKRAFDPARDALNLRVGMSDYTQRIFSPRIWEALERTTSQVRLMIHTVDRYTAESMLLDGSIDLALIGNPVLDHPMVLCDELLSDPFVVASAADGGDGPLDMQAYLAAAHLRVTAKESEVGVVDAALHALGHRREVRCIVPNYLQVPAILERSQLLATLARGVFAEGGYRLQLRAPPFPIAPVTIGLLYLHSTRSSSAQRWGADLVRTLAQELDRDTS
ncbi:MAG: LysR family transcriptional regulator [Pigmentiphaga sp.]|uniref:LysR family transcriptional regulator n=1 Tax=Pigmentiphaga sp. TaxID=1977564 RepID=UPI0029BE24B1|nr:LysR family transcriptional regulator [Pigmentiphaga sp.]MDX3904644.1 LysR family transcriptional regulator [Pigmentiphaga sp.]